MLTSALVMHLERASHEVLSGAALAPCWRREAPLAHLNLADQELSMLCVILDRALTGEEYDLISDWADESYNHLEVVINWVESSERTTDQNAIEDCLNLFKSDLMDLCADLLYRLPAATKKQFDFKWSMTADEMVECGLSGTILVCWKRNADVARLDS